MAIQLICARIMALAKEKGLYVIEDAAEAHGAKVYGKRVGSFGNINASAFYGNKIITTEREECSTCNDAGLTERMPVFARPCQCHLKSATGILRWI